MHSYIGPPSHVFMSLITYNPYFGGNLPFLRVFGAHSSCINAYDHPFGDTALQVPLELENWLRNASCYARWTSRGDLVPGEITSGGWEVSRSAYHKTGDDGC